jgi:hypothetical protein
MKKVSAAALSWLVVGSWWCVSPTNAKKTDNALASGNINEHPSTPKPFEIEDGSLSAATPNTFARTAPTPAETVPKSAKRLKIQVDVASPKDLKIKEGQQVAHNQLIADYRQPERTALIAELERVKLSIQKLKSTPKVAPIPPAQVKAVKSFITPAYTEEEAAIQKAKTTLKGIQDKYQLALKSSMTPIPETVKVRSLTSAVTDIEAVIRKQQQKIDALKTLEEIDQSIQSHEQVTMTKLQQSLMEAKLRVEEAVAIEKTALMTRSNQLEEIRADVANAQRDVNVAGSRLAAAIEKTHQLQTERQIDEIDRQDRLFRTELERIKQTEVANLQNHDRQYQLAQLQLKKTQLESQIGGLTGILAPFDGTVRRVKLVSQQGNVLRYEIGLMYAMATIMPFSDVPHWGEDKN